MATLLVVGEDVALLEIRAAVLRTTGAEIVCSHSSAALEILADRKFDLVVLCHTMGVPLRSSLAKYARVRWPQTRIMQLVPAYQEMDVDPAVDVISPSTAQDLILNTRKLIGQVIEPVRASES